MAAEKYRSPPQPPPVFTDTPESILAGTNKIIEESKRILDKIVAEVSPDKATFFNVLEPVLVDDNKYASTRNTLTFYGFVSTNKELREASSKAEELLDAANIESKAREDVFKLVEAAYNSRESQSLDKERLRILEKERQKYVRNGLLLPAGEKRDRFTAIQKRISQLCIEGQKNLNNEMGAIWFTPKELEGVPQDDVDVSQLEKGTGENEGKVKLSFKYNEFFPVMKYAIDENTRRTYVIAENNKNNNNVPLFKEIIELRDEAARILGFANHASVALPDKMAKSPETVNTFLGDLRDRLQEGGKKELEHLLEYKKRDREEHGLPFDGNFYMWDTAYYTRLSKEKEFSVEEAEISQYFPVESTFTAMLKIFEHTLGFVFVELKDEERAKLSPTGKAEDIYWHQEVRIFSVWNDEAGGSEFVGYLYIDLHPRDNKFGHNANFNIGPGFITDEGGRHYPATALVCNFSKPSATKPALLKHGEVVTLFHELGHGIHDLSGRTRFGYTHGTNVVSDFVEAPSQMLENWCWTPIVLKDLSRHWETNAQIPDDLVERLVKTQDHLSSTFTLNQLVIGIFDMTVHSPESHESIKALNAGRLWNQLRHDISGIKGPEDQGDGLEYGQRHATVGHFLSDMYAAGYYGYLYSQVFSTDMFYSHFKQDPMDKEQGRRYRKIVLERGGSLDEMEFLKEFLGRAPSSESFYEKLGLSKV